jgi:hypothetical protein
MEEVLQAPDAVPGAQLDRPRQVLTIDQVVEASRRDDEDKADVLTTIEKVTIEVSPNRIKQLKDEAAGENKTKFSKETLREALVLIADINDKERGISEQGVPIHLSMRAFKQLFSNILNIPHDHMLACLESVPSTAQQMIDGWQQFLHGTPILLRLRQDHGSYACRAALRGSHCRDLDNTPIFAAVSNVLQEHELVVTDAPHVGDVSRLRMAFSDPKFQLNLGGGGRPDPINLGLHISNSEVGTGPLDFSVITYRLICSNGVISAIEGSQVVNIKHMGKKTPKEVALIAESGIRQAKQTCQAHWQPILSLVQTPVEDPEAEIRKIFRSKDYRLPDMLLEPTIDLYKANYEDMKNKWGVTNALTLMARNMPGEPERRAQFEKAAGKYAVAAIPAAR